MAHFHHVTPILRKDRDSNPGTPKGVNGFRDRPVRPLRHLSNGRFFDFDKMLTLARHRANSSFNSLNGIFAGAKIVLFS